MQADARWKRLCPSRRAAQRLSADYQHCVCVIIFNTSVFTGGFKEWEKNHILDKTWDNLKAHFTIEHRLYRKQSHTAKSSGVHAANHAQKVIQSKMLAEHSEAIIMLASATASNRGTVSTLIATNATLSSHLAEKSAVLLAANETICLLRVENSGGRGTIGTHNRTRATSGGSG
jgi:hypothetical protein